jgi:HD-GYP domain-containing protein (c-di-GMP phosphodiesterase class II)
MVKYTVSAIPTGAVFSDTVYLDQQFIVATPEVPISGKILQMLKDWEFGELWSDGKPVIEATAETKADAKLGAILLAETSSAGTAPNDSDKITQAGEFYEAFLQYMESIFAQAAEKNVLDYQNITEQVTAACEIIRKDRRFLLRVQKTPDAESERGYLASHAVRSMIISVIIGLYLKLSNERLTELGVAALLHEIGMIKLPTESKGYFTKRALTQDERKAIFSHPVLSYSVLKSFNAPPIVCLAGLEHHERENGSGYPQKLTGNRISLYAKIIAVACSYEALTANRPHKHAKDGYSGMMDLLKNEGKQYDETIIKALLYSIAIYPIGLYVLLSNGKKGQVIDVNPENPLFPIVQVFGMFTPSGENVVMETSKKTVFIVRPLKKEEINN